MGFDLSMVQFLFGAKKQGVDFRKTLLLGRQEFHLDTLSLQAVLDQQKVVTPAPTAEELRQKTGKYCEEYLRWMGAQQVDSMDASSYEEATIIQDLNQPLNDSVPRDYSLVIDGGTLEHVYHFPQAIQNVKNLLAVGGSFLSVTTANNFLGHGFYQFSPELIYRVFGKESGFQVRAIFLRELSVDAILSQKGWHYVKDPEEILKRATLVNAAPTYIVFHVQKLREVENAPFIFQQSDYSSRWKGEASLEVNFSPNEKSRYPWIPGSLKRKLRMLQFRVRESFGNKKSPFEDSCYQTVCDLDVIHGTAWKT